MKATRYLIAAAAALLVTSAASADVKFQFGPGGVNDANLNAELTNIGIPLDASSETVAETFIVPGLAGTTTDLTFNFLFDDGFYLFNFGFFDFADVAGIDPINDKENWATQALANATLVFDDTAVNPPSSNGVFTLDAGTELGFFLIPNNTLAAFQSDASTFDIDEFATSDLDIVFNANGRLRNVWPLFSFSDANPGEFDQMFSFLANGQTVFSFEDQTRLPGSASDEDFTDLVFTIDTVLGEGIVPPKPSPIPAPAALPAGLALLGFMGLRRNRNRR